jgi:YidC/Oxa1 family membrane protein insertase
MEDKRTALAIFICIAFIMLYSELFLAPAARPVAPVTSVAAPAAVTANTTEVSSTTTNSQGQLPASPFAAPQATDKRFPNPAEIADAGYISITTPQALVRIALLGARLASFELSDYRRQLKEEALVDIVSGADGAPLPLAAVVGNVRDDFVKYQLMRFSEGVSRDGNAFALDASSELQLVFQGVLPGGTGIQKSITFKPGTYLFTVDVQLSAPAVDGSRVNLEWAHYVSDAKLIDQFDALQFTHLNDLGKLKHLLIQEVDKEARSSGRPMRDLGANRWVTFGGKYFMATLIPSEPASTFPVGVEKNVFYARAQGNAQAGSFSVYAGPKDHEVLKGLGFELHRNIDLGWFSFLAYPLIWLLRFFYVMLGNYGLAIILLTLVIKALFLPLTKASFKSMKAMQDLQPEIKALRERVKDATQLNQEMMALYKKRGVNPMGGCLPILIQLPVFLGLYNALLYSIELRHAPFALWINDLSAPEALLVFGLPIPVMVLLMGASMYLQQATTPTTGDEAQRRIMLMMPIVFTVMFVIFPFPAGLVLYWLVNNVISIIQQVYLRTDKRVTPLQATVVSSVLIFCFGWMLTLIG